MFRAIGVAVAYAIVGRLSLLLAIPPGYASPVWPAAGIAFVAVLIFGRRVAPGIVLGSFLLNLSTGLDLANLPSREAMARSFLLPVGIGIGAALQALLGAGLVRRFVGWPHPLNSGRSGATFLLLGGPASCVVNATLGPLCLILAGQLPVTAYGTNWGTWWVGDALGVVVCAPLILVWFPLQERFSPARRWVVTAALGSTLVLAVLAFVGVLHLERERTAAEFRSRSNEIHHRIKVAVDSVHAVLYGLSAYYHGSVQVDRQEFSTWTKERLSRPPGFPGLRAFGLFDRVLLADRAAFEAAIRQEGFPDFEVIELDDDRMVRAAERPEYVVAKYIEPMQGNEAALGFDAASEPIRREALEQARESGQLTATKHLWLVQERGKQPGFLLLIPLYAKERPHDTAEERRQATKAFGAGGFRTGDLIQAALKDVPHRLIRLTVSDATDATVAGVPASPNMMTVFELGGEPTVSTSAQEENRPKAELTWVTTLDIGEHLWELRFESLPGYMKAFRAWEVWAVLIAGILFSGLAGAAALIGSGKAEFLESLAVSRAEALELVVDRTKALEREIAERQQAEEAIANKNREMEAVLHVISHDLREPVRTIGSFSEIIATRHAEGLSPTGKELFGYVIGASQRLGRLIGDIMQLAKSRQGEAPVAAVEGAQIVDEALARLEEKIQATGATVRLTGTFPTLHLDRPWAVEALYNLLSNALKFTNAGAPPEIEIAPYFPAPEETRPATGFIVRDRGPGVAPKDAEMIFGLFKRAVGRDVEGTGAGLAIVREIASRHGGHAWVRPREGGGSEFIVTFGG